MCSIDFEPCEVWRETRRAARKVHECDVCGSAIKPGARYLVHFSVYDGDPTSEKVCPDCDVARKEFAKAHGGCRIPSYFREELQECVVEQKYQRELSEQDRRWITLLAELDQRKKLVEAWRGEG